MDGLAMLGLAVAAGKQNFAKNFTITQKKKTFSAAAQALPYMSCIIR